MEGESPAARQEHLLGFLRVELALQALLKSVLASSSLQDREVYLFDATDEDDPLFLTSSLAASESAADSSGQKLPQLQSASNQTLQTELGGRHLLFLVRPGPGYSWIDGIWDALGILLIGTLITAALIVYLRMRDQALAQMQQAEKHYRDLFEAAPAMTKSRYLRSKAKTTKVTTVICAQRSIINPSSQWMTAPIWFLCCTPITRIWRKI